MSIIGRRELLRSAGALALASGLSTIPRLALGAPGPPKRLVIMFFPYGSTHAQGTVPWGAIGAGATFNTGRLNHPEFVKHKNNLLFLHNCDNRAGANTDRGINGHDAGFYSVLTGASVVSTGGIFGTSGGISIDQYLAGKKLAPLPVLSLGHRAFKTMSAAGLRQSAFPELDVGRAFDKVFAFAKAVAPNAGAAELAALRRRVLGVGLKDLEDFAKTAPKADREKLQFHSEAISKLEADIANAGAVTCAVPGRPGAPPDPQNQIKTMLDLTAQAIACDITRIVTIQWTHIRANDSLDYSFSGAPGNHHLNSHGKEAGPNGLENFAKAATWFSGQMGYLMTKLAAIDDGGGRTALDNTAVVWVTEIGGGVRHDHVNVPFIIGGGLGGAVKGGRVLNVSGKTNNDLWVSMLRGLGFNDATFGDPRYNSGAINLA